MDLIKMKLETYLENYLLEQIPITSAMGVKVSSASPSQVVIQASFLKNINHKKTVFGGSLHSIATLACWGLLHIKLLNQNAQIVIAESKTDYLAPVNSDFKAESFEPDTKDWDHFIKIFQKRGKARISLHAKIFQEGMLCVDYSGIFVAIRNVK
jgi:thioesterase domain-containing protein